MYRHILITTDGSELSKKAEVHGIALAKSVGAKVTGITVTMPIEAYFTSEVAVTMDPGIFEERTAQVAHRHLEAIAKQAEEAGVECKTLRIEQDPIYQGIIDAAQSESCDLIVMASHGRRGLSGFILGSETTKVLTHSKFPVLVYR